MRRTLLAIGLFASIGQSALADETLGNWCWRMAPASDSMNAAIVIKKTTAGDFVMERTFYDGSKQKVGLREAGKNRFLQKDNEFGDGVQIRSDGFLQMFDSEGMLDRARPLAPNQCIKK